MSLDSNHDPAAPSARSNADQAGRPGSPAADLRMGATPMRLNAFRVGAAAWIFTGVVHDILEFVLSGDPELDRAMRGTDFAMGPITLNAADLSRGVSLEMGLAIALVGLLLLMIARTLHGRPDLLRPFVIVALAASAASLGLALVLIPGPPVATFTVATIAFIVALVPKKAPAAAR